MTPNLILAQAQTPQLQSTAVVVTIVGLLAAGLVGWLIAAVVGFTRGAAARWFALSALCLIIYHLHLLAFALLGTKESDVEKLLRFGSFFNLFVFLGSLCAIIGFLKLPKPRQ
ncbi:MAG: hypothetical protein QOF61_330 [Acidobacteriota bacterium]|jgi:hypothetical protein|nr:hypothetical protein [Acidobacteriota bacterium]